MKKAFVIGHPISHSKSPLIHGTWLEQLGIAGRYEAIDVAPNDLGAFLKRVREGAFVGGNVTIPHKEAVVDLIDDIDPLAAQIGAVNTIVSRDGKLFGSNTDYMGVLANLDAGAPGWRVGLDEAIVLGAGGAARAVVAGLIDRGIGKIHVLNRTSGRAEALAETFGTSILPASFADFAALAPKAGLVVNTTSVGMDGTRFDWLTFDGLKSGAVVTDIVYTPLITPFLAQARARGFATVDGLGMLLYQAVPGFTAWFGKTPEVTQELRAKILGAA